MRLVCSRVSKGDLPVPEIRSTRNSKWNRDELILALDLYLKTRPRRLSESDPNVIALSKVLNSLPAARSANDPSRFRNTNGVKMKCGNFMRFDPYYKDRGRTGLSRGNRLEQVVWDEFSSDPSRLAAVADAIRRGAVEASASLPDRALEGDEEFQEGEVLTRIHTRRERDPRASAAKKAAVLKATGRLECEACGFDFEARYGGLGAGFAECHHRLPLAALGRRTATRLADLAVLCANCHRMIHKTRPLMAVEEFRRLVAR